MPDPAPRPEPAVRLAEALDRIERENERLRALVPEPGRRPRVLAREAALDARRPDPSDRMPLFRVLLGIKDVFHVDGLETRAGTSLPPDVFRDSQGRAVIRLLDAGAIVLGKTRTDELAYA
ncbi:MAG: amidase family protein, partial [Candidatus Eisenbacteria bacterium]|nr:amidase family protein [Candidatus Eisenbacteria bacterium]